MNKRRAFIFTFISISAFISGSKSIDKLPELIEHDYKNQISDELIKLKQAYPDFIFSIRKNALTWNDSTIFIYNDSSIKFSYNDTLNYADLEEQMIQKYSRGKLTIYKKNHDPGRIRNEAFFQKMYGATEEQVSKNLVEVAWLPKSANKKLLITKINRVDLKVKQISDELDNNPYLLRYVDNPGGSFCWRYIENTTRVSTHSYGIAIDINVNCSNYWLWDEKKGTRDEKVEIDIPYEIVEIFEKHGFIWGGKWYHYDTMHFEYRPELLLE